ncbi:hypothetical protein [Cylindrospermum sp. FACHB-282]|uniref:hypothetical protein n=1 Tax=Cylindrospermum sp. FACHB-282 TaxID=2692794 RepID=UPI0019B7637E|nr:hypothetical protein [Cylindrospermum sp. FACHB-282]MBD2385186.1 hypothetical protein [Cylindrospermum sp. FACHB-282]
MTTIMISDLHPIDDKTFFHDLTSEEMNAISGSENILLTLLGEDTLLGLTTVHDGVNNTSTTYNGPFSLYNNKLFTVDFSRLTIYLVL